MWFIVLIAMGDYLYTGPDGFSEGDWLCSKCGNTNFAFRTTCNMRKCGATKPTENVRSQVLCLAFRIQSIRWRLVSIASTFLLRAFGVNLP